MANGCVIIYHVATHRGIWGDSGNTVRISDMNAVSDATMKRLIGQIAKRLGVYVFRITLTGRKALETE